MYRYDLTDAQWDAIYSRRSRTSYNYFRRI
jgi:hypothetical protein